MESQLGPPGTGEEDGCFHLLWLILNDYVPKPVLQTVDEEVDLI